MQAGFGLIVLLFAILWRGIFWRCDMRLQGKLRDCNLREVEMQRVFQVP